MEQKEKSGEGVSKRRLGASLKRMIPRAQHDHTLIPTRAMRRRCALCGKMGNIKDMRLSGNCKDVRSESNYAHLECMDRLAAAQKPEEM